MRKRLFAAMCAGPAALALGACERVTEPVVCSLPFIPPSVNVAVQDSVTGANVTPGSTLVLRSASGVVDSVSIDPQPGYVIVSASLGYSAVGTFSLTVRHAGYQEWTKSGIEVEGEPCGARTVSVTAHLRPAP